MPLQPAAALNFLLVLLCQIPLGPQEGRALPRERLLSSIPKFRTEMAED